MATATPELNADAAPAARFWTTYQNNSGGIFDHDAEKGIGYAICVEALDRADANRRLLAIIDSYPASLDCPCCGDRWSVWFYADDNGDTSPTEGSWPVPSYIHYLDGRIEARAPKPEAA
jgi:hypothetical protein